MNTIHETNSDASAIRVKLHQLFAMVVQNNEVLIETTIDKMFAENFPAVDAARRMLSLEKRLGKEFDLTLLHDASYENGAAIRASETLCGCFDCGSVFSSSDIRPDDYQAEEDGALTVFCPYCLNDAVISRVTTDYPIDKDSLAILHDLFSTVFFSTVFPQG